MSGLPPSLPNLAVLLFSFWRSLWCRATCSRGMCAWGCPPPCGTPGWGSTCGPCRAPCRRARCGCVSAWRASQSSLTCNRCHRRPAPPPDPHLSIPHPHHHNHPAPDPCLSTAPPPPPPHAPHRRSHQLQLVRRARRPLQFEGPASRWSPEDGPEKSRARHRRQMRLSEEIEGPE